MSDILILDLGTTIKGNCQVTGYADKIILLSYAHGVDMPLQRDTANTERTSGRPIIGDFQFTKMTDLSTTELYQYCVKGTPIPTAKLHVGRIQGDSGAYVALLTYEFTNVLIANISTSGSGGVPMDSFSLNFTKITCEYNQQQSSSAAKGTAAWGWDMETVKVAGK
jgi:type VI secretion system secreted protein Hcp